MKALANSLSYIIGAVVSLAVAVAILAISKLPYNFVFSIIFGAIAFFVFLSITNVGEKNFDFTSGKGVLFLRGRISNNSLIILAYAICIVIVLLVPATNGGQFIDWVSIPIANYIRLLAGILLSSILPGYGLLTLVDRSGTFSHLASLLFSFFISVFIMAVLTFCCVAVGLSMAVVFWVILLANLVIILLISVKSFRNRGKTLLSINSSRFTIKIDYVIIFLIFLFFIAGWIVYYSSYQLGSPWDMWDHYYAVSQVSSGYLLSPSHLSGVGAESWFALHYIAVWQLSGFPQLNGFMIYSFINFFYILSFYLMVKGLVGDKYPRLPILSTVIAVLFAGFGWIEALWLSANPTFNWFSALQTGGVNAYNDVIYNFIYGPIPQFFVLSALFMLIYLMTNKGRFTTASAFLILALVAQGLLVHSPEIMFFSLFYLCYLLFEHHDSLAYFKKYSFSMLLGLVAVIIIGLPFVSHFYFNMSSLLIPMLAVVGLTFIIIRIKPKVGTIRIPQKISFFLIVLVWVFYFLSFFAWNSIINQNLNITSILGGEAGVKPWYIYPINSGTSLFLGLLGLTYIIARKVNFKNSNFLAWSLAVLFISGIALSFVNVYVNPGNIGGTYWEKRFYTFMIIPISIFGSYAVLVAAQKIQCSLKIRRFSPGLEPYSVKLLVGLLVAVILISGVMSSVLSLDYIQISSRTDPFATCSKAELAALNFLRANASADATVLGLSAESNRLAYIFSGLNHLNSPDWFTSEPTVQFANITNPELSLKMLYSLNITYLFATSDDLYNLNSIGYVNGHLIKYLPIVFSNSEVTIFEIPKMNPPTLESNLSLVMPDFTSNLLSNSGNYESNFNIDALALSSLNYSIKNFGDASIFEGNFIILSEGDNWTSNQLNTFISWVQNGGNLVVLDSASKNGSFANLLSINSISQENISSDRAVGQSAFVNFGALSVNPLISEDPKVKVVVSYTNGKNESAPLAFVKPIGKGELVYVNIEPFIEKLLFGDAISRSNFKFLGNIIDILNLKTSAFIDTPPIERWKYASYDLTLVRNYANLVGSSTISSNSISLLNKTLIVGLLKQENGREITNLLSVKDISEHNLNVKNLSIDGPTVFQIDSPGMYIIPSNYGQYSELLLKSDFNLTIEVPKEGITFWVTDSNNKTCEYSAHSGRILFENITPPNSTDNSELGVGCIFYVYSPIISTNGTIFFEEAYTPNYISLVRGYNFTINGVANFTVDTSSGIDNVIVLKSFIFTGFSKSGQEATKISLGDWEITKIDWGSIISSQLFILSSILIITLLFFVAFHSKVLVFWRKIAKRNSVGG